MTFLENIKIKKLKKMMIIKTFEGGTLLERNVELENLISILCSY
jgi:hypothetical protein